MYPKKRRRIFYKQESVRGTAELAAALYAAACGKTQAYDIKITPNVSSMDRHPDGLTFDSIDSIYWGENYTVTFTSYAHCGTGIGVAPGYSPLYKSCGMTETIVASTSTTYTPDSDLCPTLTIGVEIVNDAGDAVKRVTLAGCLGNVTCASGAIGQPGVLSWSFTGKAIPTPDADSTPVATITYDDATTKLPRLISTTITDGGVSVQANAFTFDRGLATEWETDLGDATGYKSRVVANSDPTLTIDPAMMPGSSQATLDQFFKGTTGAVAITIGSVAGNRIKINLARAQKASLSDDVRGNTSTWGTKFKSHRSSVTGNGDDAFTIVYD